MTRTKKRRAMCCPSTFGFTRISELQPAVDPKLRLVGFRTVCRAFSSRVTLDVICRAFVNNFDGLIPRQQSFARSRLTDQHGLLDIMSKDQTRGPPYPASQVHLAADICNNTQAASTGEPQARLKLWAWLSGEYETSHGRSMHGRASCTPRAILTYRGKRVCSLV